MLNPMLGTISLFAAHSVSLTCEIPSDGQWRHLRGIRRPSRSEHTPRNVAKRLTNQEDLNRRREEDDEDESREPCQRRNQDLAMTPARSGPSIHQRTDNVCNGCQTIKSLLPGGRNLVSAIVVKPDAVLSSEHRIPVEGSQPGDIFSSQVPGSLCTHGTTTWRLAYMF
jgi:hypothetical protein